MKKKGIEVHLRVRPTKKPCPGLSLSVDEGKVEFNFQRDGLRHLEVRDDYY
jgi:kinesin family protein 6/9